MTGVVSTVADGFAAVLHKHSEQLPPPFHGPEVSVEKLSGASLRRDDPPQSPTHSEAGRVSRAGRCKPVPSSPEEPRLPQRRRTSAPPAFKLWLPYGPDFPSTLTDSWADEVDQELPISPESTSTDSSHRAQRPVLSSASPAYSPVQFSPPYVGGRSTPAAGPAMAATGPWRATFAPPPDPNLSSALLGYVTRKLQDPAINRRRGSFAHGTVMAMLEKEPISAGLLRWAEQQYGSFKAFVEAHSETLQVVYIKFYYHHGRLRRSMAPSSHWRVRCVAHVRWAWADEENFKEEHAKNCNLLETLKRFIQSRNWLPCDCDTFADAYPWLPPIAGPRYHHWELPKRGDLLRLADSDAELFTYYPDEYSNMKLIAFK